MRKGYKRSSRTGAEAQLWIPQALDHYFCFAKSARFKSRSTCGITFTSGKSFFKDSRNAGALPTTIRLGNVARYLFAKFVTSFVVTALIFGINSFSRSSGRLYVASDARLSANPSFVSKLRA